MKPLVSVILATYNEARHIEATLRALLAQAQSEFELEILVVDGNSCDETVSRVVPFLSDTRVKLLKNPARIAPVAFNIGLRAAAGDFVCILGAHAHYPSNYIETCYRELLTHDATGCSGRVITVPANDAVSGKLAAWCLGNGFASSPNSVRTRSGGFAETIPYPVFRKAALLKVGAYNEQLVRNQDNDMNHRLRAAGHKLYLTSKTYATYIARPDVSSLWTYAYRSGKWNAYTLGINASCMGLRHFAAFVFVSSIVMLSSLALLAQSTHHAASIPLTLLGFVLSIHLLFGLLAGAHTCIQERSIAALLLPFIILGFHLAYGFGTLAGSVSLLSGTYSAANNTSATAPS
jgi:glycosyltransferase involved in cell wall biosynthesis